MNQSEDMMDITRPIITALVKATFDALKDRIKEYKQSPKEIEATLECHLNEVAKWSGRIQFYGMSSAEETDATTIKLRLESVPRKFRCVGISRKQEGEDSLLQDGEHYLVLGDPGSGKTTTLKRLARRMLLEPPSSQKDTYQYPIVIRLREMEKNASLYTILAQLLGFKYKVIQRKRQQALSVGEEVLQILVNDSPIEIVVPKILNSSKALLLLDGLDEISRDRRDALEKEIGSLAYSLSESKIIVSCRSGDFVQHFDGFNIVEICPLDRDQITAIAGRWLDPVDEFIEHLNTLPYRDLADRPLFLTQLLFFYKSYGYLPEQPSAVYKRIVNLMLEDWDAQRKVMRKSRYASFNPDRKMEFLSSLSYELTYKIKTKVFSTSDLMRAYSSIYQAFDLPEQEAEDVAKEIETHTGIIVESGHDAYEFSHLSLQEYLCAYYLVREPFAQNIGEYLKEYPAPLAIAVVLSSNSSNWFAALILRQENFGHFTPQNLSVFLSRLLSEKPFFAPSTPLGLAALNLCFNFRSQSDTHLDSYIQRLLDSKGVKQSIAECMRWFAIDPVKGQPNNHYFLKRRFHFKNEYEFTTPEGGFFPKELLLEIAKAYSSQLTVLQGTGLAIPYENSGLV